MLFEDGTIGIQCDHNGIKFEKGYRESNLIKKQLLCFMWYFDKWKLKRIKV